MISSALSSQCQYSSLKANKRNWSKSGQQFRRSRANEDVYVARLCLLLTLVEGRVARKPGSEWWGQRDITTRWRMLAMNPGHQPSGEAEKQRSREAEDRMEKAKGEREKRRKAELHQTSELKSGARRIPQSYLNYLALVHASKPLGGHHHA